MNTRILLHQGDITRLKADAIVNAANSSLLGGGGVDGAIHRAAGPQLLEECKTLNGCPTGQAKLTKGYLLSAGNVIHTVGPIWRGGNHQEPEFLKSCYLNCLSIARDHQFKTLAFPNISTGVYGFPKVEAAKIAIYCITSFLKENQLPEKVILAIFDEENLHIYERLLNVTE